MSAYYCTTEAECLYFYLLQDERSQSEARSRQLSRSFIFPQWFTSDDWHSSLHICCKSLPAYAHTHTHTTDTYWASSFLQCPHLSCREVWKTTMSVPSSLRKKVMTFSLFNIILTKEFEKRHSALLLDKDPLLLYSKYWHTVGY